MSLLIFLQIIFIFIGITATGVSAKCHKNDMTINLPKTLLLELNREHVTLRNVNCVVTETSTHHTLKTSLTGCGATARHRKAAVTYSNTVLEIPVKDDAIITRVRREIEIPFSCYYKNSGDAIAVGLKPDTRKLVFDEDGKETLQLVWKCSQMTSKAGFNVIY